MIKAILNGNNSHLEITNLTEKQARAIIDAVVNIRDTNLSNIDRDIRDIILESENKLYAIRTLKQKHNLDLKTAKDLIEAAWDNLKD